MVEPAMRPLHDIACPPQAAAMRAAAHRQQRPDAPGQDQRDRPGEAVAPIPLQHRGTAAPAVAQDRPQPPQQARQRLLIPSVGRPRLRHQREPLAVRDEMPFTALFGPIRGVGARVGAAAHRPLRTAVDDGALQVEQALFPSAVTKATWAASHTPAAVHSSKRRQQVLPEPQPNAIGRDCQRRPSRSTKTMPFRQRRSGTRRRPPWGEGGCTGNHGATAFHSGSFTSVSMAGSP